MHKIKETAQTVSGLDHIYIFKILANTYKPLLTAEVVFLLAVVQSIFFVFVVVALIHLSLLL